MGVDVDGNKRGRPIIGRARNNRVDIRCSDETIHMLNYICEKRGLNKTDLLEEVIRTQYNLTKFMD